MRNVAGRFGYGLVDGLLAVCDSSAAQASMLNWTASLVWLELLDGHRSQDELSRALVEASRDPVPAPGQVISALLDQWSQRGWVRRDADGTWCLLDDEQPVRDLPGAPDWMAAQVLWSRSLRLNGKSLKLEIKGRDGADAQRVAAFFGGLEETCPSVSAPVFALGIMDGGHCLDLQGQRSTAADLAEASGDLMAAIIDHAYSEFRDILTLHAAAASRPGGAIIFPAVTGAGKTTLTAFLVAMGWKYGGDDVIGIGNRRKDGQELQVLPLPSALGIKAGSRHVLAHWHPEASGFPTVRYGGKEATFVRVPREAHMPDTSDWRTPRALVLPVYEANTACTLDAISETEALTSMLAAGSGAGSGMTPSAFSTLVGLVQSMPRYRLRYSSLEEARIRLEVLV